MADNCHLIAQSTDRKEGASSLKIVDDFIATRQKQLLDSQIVTFNLKRTASKQRRLRDTPVKLWTLPELEGTTATKRTDKRGVKKPLLFISLG